MRRCQRQRKAAAAQLTIEAGVVKSYGSNIEKGRAGGGGGGEEE